MLSARSRDISKAGLVNWPLTSVATWGERPLGTWHIIVQDMVILLSKIVENTRLDSIH